MKTRRRSTTHARETVVESRAAVLPLLVLCTLLLAACGPAATAAPTGLPAPAATLPPAPTARLAPTPVPLTSTSTPTPTPVPPAARVNGEDIPLAGYELALARCEELAAVQGQRAEQAGCASRTISTLIEREIVWQAAGRSRGRRTQCDARHGRRCGFSRDPREPAPVAPAVLE